MSEKKQYSLADITTDLQLFSAEVAVHSLWYRDFFKDLEFTGLRFCELQDFSRWSPGVYETVICDTAKDSNNREFRSDEFFSDFYSRVWAADNIYKRINNSTASYYFHSFHPMQRIYVEDKYLTNHLFRHHKAKYMKYRGYSDEEIRAYFGEVSILNIQGYIYSDIWCITR